MEHIEQAVAVALSSTAEASHRAQAMSYCEQVKESQDGWQMCLQLFVRNPKSSPEARLFALQVVEEMVQNRFSTLNASQAEGLRQGLLEFIRQEYTSPEAISNEPEPIFLRNKLAHTLVLLLSNCYLSTWPSFFDDLLSLQTSPGAASDPRVMQRVHDLLLRVWMSIDEECVSALVPRSKDALNRNTLIKDQMREGDVTKMVSHWYGVLEAYPDKDVTLVNMALRVISVYISWIDVSFIVNDTVMGTLFRLFQRPDYRVSASDCLAEIIAKGMKPGDKLSLIQAVKVAQLASSSSLGEDEDEDFLQSVARLVNITGLELRGVWDEVELRAAANAELASLFPYILHFLSSKAGDGEVTSRIFPVINELLNMFKKIKKAGGMGSRCLALLDGPQRTFLTSLVQAMILRMQHPKDREWEFPEEDEEERQLQELRKALDVFLDNVAQLDGAVFEEYVQAAIYKTLNALEEQGATAVHWTDVELSLHLLHLTGETVKGTLMYTRRAGGSGDESGSSGSYTSLGRMVAKLVETNVTSAFPHPAVCLGFLECIARFVHFFEGRKAHLSAALSPFVDQRGLHHPNKTIRHRAWYLFFRFTKALRHHLAPFVEDILQALPDLLVIQAELPEASTGVSGAKGPAGGGIPTPRPISDFDQQVYLFETVGLLIAAEEGEEKQRLLLEMALESILRPLEQNPVTTSSDALGILQRHHYIMAVGAIAKGLPDAPKPANQGTSSGDSSVSSPTATANGAWIPGMVKATGVVLTVLEGMKGFELIREATRYTVARLVNCLGLEILPLIPRLISGLLTECTIGELTDFLPFTGLIVHKFRPSIYPIIDDLLWPLISKVFLFLDQRATGTDEAVVLMELRKAYLNLIIALFNADVDGIFLSERNAPHLNTILQSVLHYAKADVGYENQTQKASFGILHRMTNSWGGGGEGGKSGGSGGGDGGKGGGGGNRTSSASPTPTPKSVPGFERFLYESVAPVCFQVPMSSSFNLGDGQSLLIFTEIAHVLKAIYEQRGEEFMQFLTSVYLPSIQCPALWIEELTNALRSMDAKQFRKYYQSFIVKTK